MYNIDSMQFIPLPFPVGGHFLFPQHKFTRYSFQQPSKLKRCWSQVLNPQSFQQKPCCDQLHYACALPPWACPLFLFVFSKLLNIIILGNPRTLFIDFFFFLMFILLGKTPCLLKFFPYYLQQLVRSVKLEIIIMKKLMRFAWSDDYILLEHLSYRLR